MITKETRQTQEGEGLPPLIPVSAAARLLDISEAGLRDKIKRGVIPGIKIGARLYVKRDEFMEKIEGGAFNVRP